MKRTVFAALVLALIMTAGTGAVQPVPFNDTGVTIGSGLSGNEAVVVSAGPFLSPGQKVKPRREASH